MKQEWAYWVNCVSHSDCDALTSLALKLPEHKPTLGFDSGVSDDNMRRSVLRWIDPVKNPEFTYIHDLMWKTLIRVNHDFFNFNVTALPPMQFTEYDESYLGEYKMHQDVFWVNPGPNHRKISLIVQLTDPSEYEGGDLKFHYTNFPPTDGDMKEMKKKGTVIAFPSFLFHQLTPVTKGKRRSLVAWFEGPKFQ